MQDSVNEIQFYDIYDIWYTPWYKTYYFYIALMCTIVGALYLLYRWYKNRKVYTEELSAAQKALRLIEHLKKTPQDPKDTYTTLIHLLKVYLESHYTLSLIGKTDDEFLSEMTSSAVISKEVLNDIRVIFNGVTFIKFAGEAAQEEQLKKAIELSEKIIRTTTDQTKVPLNYK